MKIIQSFWTRNSFKLEQLQGSWLDHSYALMSWALSNHTITQFYDVELYTDDFGYDILVNKLGLNYKKVHFVFNHYPYPFSDKLWCYNKLYTYSLQEEPFLHIDGDVFIWKAFDDALLDSPLIAQNLEKNLPNYIECLAEMKVHFDYLPDYIFNNQLGGNDLLASNAGIFGGTNYSFFKQLRVEAFDLLDKNKDFFDRVPIGYMNIMSEQYLFDLLAEQNNIKINYLLNEVAQPPNYLELNLLSRVPKYRNYIHIMGAKKNAVTCHQMAVVLFRENRALYKRCFDTSGHLSKINSLLKQHKTEGFTVQENNFERTIHAIHYLNISKTKLQRITSNQLKKIIQKLENKNYTLFYVLADLFNYEYQRNKCIKKYKYEKHSPDGFFENGTINDVTTFNLNEELPIIASSFDWSEENEFQNTPFNEKIAFNISAQPHSHYTILVFDYHANTFYEQHLDTLSSCILEYAIEKQSFTFIDCFDYINEIFDEQKIDIPITSLQFEEYLSDMVFNNLLRVTNYTLPDANEVISNRITSSK